MSSSVTIRVPRRDKERLERLARKTGKKKLSEAFRLAISAAERETENSFRGNVDALIKAHEFAKPVGGNISENVDKVLAEIVYDETKADRKRASPPPLTIILDTGLFYAYFDKKDNHHFDSAALLYHCLEGRFGTPFTSDYVALEITLLIQRKLGDDACLSFLDFLRVSGLRTIVVGKSTINLHSRLCVTTFQGSACAIQQPLF